MIRNLKKRTWAIREQLLAALLVPTFFFGTLPQIACICADGHRMQHCPLQYCPLQYSVSPKRSCCSDHEQTSNATRSCCGSGGCQSQTSDGSRVFAVATANSRCCHPVVELPAPAASVKKADVTAKATLVGMIASPVSLVAATELWPTLAAPIQSTPPPLDVVVFFSRLTI
jgi:hypothetical protein